MDVRISAAQQRIITAIAKFARNDQPAFVPELVQELGLANASSVNSTLKTMQRNGLVEVAGGGAKGRSRVVRLTTLGRNAAGIGGLPLLGRIAAGYLTEALAEPEEMIDYKDLLPSRDGDFLLRVTGDSMTGDGILDGDKVLLRPGVDWRDGEIAAVQVGYEREATLKRIYREGAKIRLKPSNDRFPEIIVNASDVIVAGVFRGLVRD
ncbi:MAG: transcriptional repressor LexA [Chthoniobacterales bacterium]